MNPSTKIVVTFVLALALVLAGTRATFAAGWTRESDAVEPWRYQILDGSLGPSTGGCNTTLTVRATLLTDSGTGGVSWVPAVGKQLEFGFRTTGSAPATWVPSTTDANGQATAKMLVPAGAVQLWAQYRVSSNWIENLSIAFNTPEFSLAVSNATYDGNPHRATATWTDSCGVNLDLPVFYSGQYPTTYPESLTPPTNAGDYAASASYFAAPYYFYDVKTYTIAKANATINLAGWSGMYDGAAHGASGAAAGVGGVDLSRSLKLGASFTEVPGGTAHWSFTGGTNYNDASGGAQIVINKAPSATGVTVAGGESFIYDGNAHPATVAVIGAGGLNLTPAPEYSCGHAPVDVADSGCTATYTYTGDTNHEGSSASVTYTIAKANATINLAGWSGMYDGAAHGASGAAAGVGGVDLSRSLKLGASFADVPGGTAHWNFTGGTNYNDASGGAQIVINKAPSATGVTVAGGESFIYDGNAHPAAISVTGVGGLSLTPAPEYSCGHAPVDVVDSGCMATYTYAGDANHEGSSGSVVTYTIAKAPSTTMVTVGDATYDGSPHGGTAVATGVGGFNQSLSVTYSGRNTKVYGPNETAPTAAGDYRASASFAGDANHLNSAGSKDYAIAKAVASVRPNSFTRQYSDQDPTFTGALSGFLASDGVTADYKPAPPASAPGDYNIIATLGPADVLDNYDVSYYTGALRVIREDAHVSFDPTNPVALQVSAPGGSLKAGALTFRVNVQELPDVPATTAAAGDINLAGLAVTMAPLADGATITLNCSAPSAGSGYVIKTFTCTNDVAIPVDTYEVTASVTGNTYVGVGYDDFTVYDPSLGFATSAGWFYWPGTGDKTNFGFTMKYNKSGANLKGNLLVIRHHQDGTISRIKSNALEGLALQNIGGCSVATFIGKATVKTWDPGLGAYVNSGGNAFAVYAEDCNNPGSGVDSFWIRSVGDLALPTPAPSNKVQIGGGNIAVAHAAKQ
jgi:hypothetical protein